MPKLGKQSLLGALDSTLILEDPASRRWRRITDDYHEMLVSFAKWQLRPAYFTYLLSESSQTRAALPKVFTSYYADLWRKINGRAPPSGQIKASCARAVKTVKNGKHISVLMALCSHAHWGEIRFQPVPRNAIAAIYCGYHQYLNFLHALDPRQQPVSIDVLVRTIIDLHIGERQADKDDSVRLVKCRNPSCKQRHMPVLYQENHSHMECCPWCNKRLAGQLE